MKLGGTSLLEKAKLSGKRRRQDLTEDDIKLALGCLKNEVTIGECCHAYDKDGSTNGAATAYKLLRALRIAYIQGRVKVEIGGD